MRLQTERTKQGEVDFRKELDEFELVKPLLQEHASETLGILQGLNLPLSTDSKVAEVGAGHCERLLTIVKGYNLDAGWAFDISPETMEYARLIDHPISERLNFVPGDIFETGPQYPNYFNAIFCIATVHHFPEPRPLFQVMYSMLSPGGVLYFDHDPLRSWLGLHEVVRVWRNRGRVAERDFGILENQFSYDEWMEAFEVFDRHKVGISFPPSRTRFKLRRWHQITGGRLSGLLYKNA